MTWEYGVASIQKEKSRKPYQIDRLEVQKLLADKRLVNLEETSFDAIFHGLPVRVDTSLDVSLQQYLQKKLKRSTSRYIGIVIMDATSGDIVSMVGYDKTDPRSNPCIDNRFPAASIFKIITAAAAVEACGFNPDSTFTFNGRKHTLYKSQLKDRRNRYTHKITLRDSFAQSINPVFGKIGARSLGKLNLEKYAEAFGFNRNIDFEIPVTPSRVTLSDEPYRLAEIASGFNRETTISPLHGVLLAAAVLNQGKLIAPTIIEKVTDEHGHVIYRSDLTTINQAVTPKATEILSDLMQATVRSGTSRKAFKGYRRDRILSKLIIGGKTGSISSKTHDARYDWFVGFAEEKQGFVKLAISVVVAHEKYIGTRAGQYARMGIRHYFKNHYSKQNTASDIARKSS
jgi:cell division protein FtsI/penicillin-binding protein 2